MDDLTVPDSQVDNDIVTIREQIELLRQRRSHLSSLLLSSPRTADRLERAKAGSASRLPSLNRAVSLVEKQVVQNREKLHRICAGITTFRVQDPDPYAVDDGRVLGVRIEVFADGTFLTPYYLLLHRATPGSPALKIHKHTIPPSIPLASLAAKYLPVDSADSTDTAPAQNLSRLVRELRKELVSHHLRLCAIAKLRWEAGLQERKKEAKREEGPNDALEEDSDNELRRQRGQRQRQNGTGKGGISDVKADATGRDVRIVFAGGRVARLRLARNGRIEKAVVRDMGAEEGASKRDWEMEQKILSGDGRIENVIARILHE